ncbi:diaminopimelate decarboxylase, chloroplastic [Biomphalaria glabrata]|nr:diaminopimelate decarboxylase, chloroplastic [Biomphalaria glabrata]
MPLECRISNGTFFCEKLSHQDIIEACQRKLKVAPTPLFVYSKAQIVKNIRMYLDALKLLDCESQLNYAVKANPNFSLLRLIRSQGASATLISGNEIRLALEAGFEPTLMMYNGGGKCQWETQLAIEHNLLINVDSLWDLKQTLDICRNGFPETRTARLLLRINLNIDSSVHNFVNTGKADSKFGLSEKESEACLELLEQPGCPAELVGLHSHLGSTIYQSDVFRLSLERLLEYRSKLVSRGFIKVSLINIGGGLGIDYKLLEFETKAWQSESEDNKKNILQLKEFLLNLEEDQTDGCSRKNILSSLSAYVNESIAFEDLRLATTVFLSTNKHLGSKVDQICSSLTVPKPVHATPLDLIQSVSDLLKGKDVKLIIEPGRSIVANSSAVIARILGCKQSSEKRFIILDVSMTEIIRPCLYGAYHHVTILNNSDSSNKMEKKVFNVVGPVCESSDFLAQIRMLPDTCEGYAIIHDVGAYCYSMASNYNVRMRPAEVLVDGHDCILIRRPDTYEDFMAPYKEI